MADEPEAKPLKDNAFIQEMMTVYLLGLYVVKGGRLSPDESTRHLLGFASMAEKMSSVGKHLMKFMDVRK